MRFEAPLIRGTLVRRYKRFLADVVLEDGSKTTVHCPNTGSMLGCRSPGSTVWLLPASNPARKYPLGWELVEVDLAVLKDVNTGRSVDPAVLVGIDTGRSVDSAVLVGINTGRSNALVAEALDRGLIPELAAYGNVRREVQVPGTRSRIDFLLSGHPQDPDCYLEVKNVTAAGSGDNAFFPGCGEYESCPACRGAGRAGIRGTARCDVLLRAARRRQPCPAGRRDRSCLWEGTAPGRFWPGSRSMPCEPRSPRRA